MKKLSRSLYLMPAIMFILIGILHLSVHYNELITNNVANLLNHTIPLMGKDESVWKMWQGFSFMMGFCFIIIGLLHLNSWFNIDKDAYPPIRNTLIMIILLVGVVYAGLNFFNAFQVYGGIFGITILSIALVLTIKNK